MFKITILEDIGMKKIVICSIFCALLSAQTKAQTMDILAEDELINPTPQGNIAQDTTEADIALDNLPETETDTAGEENGDEAGNSSASFFSFVTKPISLLFSAEDEVKTPEGKTETFLERSIRQANEGKLADQMNLGYMYLYGSNGVQQNFEEAFKYYTMAAAQNDPIALNNLGSLYFNGIGTQINTRRAIELFEKAATAGNDSAATNLAFIYLTGGTKDSFRNQRAVELFQQASNSGNNVAKFMLGYAYYKGFVVEQNNDEAFKLISATALGDSNLDEAQIVLAEMYIKGKGTVQNYTNGVKSYRMAINQGNTEAYMRLAEIYKNGKIYNENPITAHALYNIAAVHEAPNAAEERDKIAKKLKLEELIQAQTEAQNFNETPSELTQYVRQTYGYNIRNYIDINFQPKNTNSGATNDQK